MKNVLIVAPIYSFKKDLVEEYLKAIKGIVCGLGYTLSLFFVDNTDDKGEYVREFEKALKETNLPFKYSVVRAEFDYEAHSRERVGMSYAMIRSHFLGNNYDAMFIIEQDVIVPKDCFIKLMAELEKGKQVVSAWVAAPGAEQGCTKHFDLWGQGNRCKRILFSDAEFNELLKQKVFISAHVSMGCLLIKREIVEQVPFEWNNTHIQHPDTFFSGACKKRGIKIYMHSGVKPVHKWREWRKERGGVVPL